MGDLAIGLAQSELDPVDSELYLVGKLGPKAVTSIFDGLQKVWFDAAAYGDTHHAFAVNDSRCILLESMGNLLLAGFHAPASILKIAAEIFHVLL
ncbi:MAG TPA: hypothetical protein VFT87_01015 [Candidatus Saccharimonadales bacterium]|nr:hypothetical protein [Candidatus Saccharimonadales bacterium]